MGFTSPRCRAPKRAFRRFQALGGAIAAAAALALTAAAAPASADAIPGPPLVSAAHVASVGPAGAYCRLRERSGWSDAGLAAAMAAVVIASRRSKQD